jgi:hypothetical protein
MMRILRALIIVALTPLALCLGVYGCTMAHVAAIQHAAGATLDCPAATQAHWQASGWSLATLPAAPCLMRSDTGAYKCDRKNGCLKCNVATPCPELKS